MKKNLFSWMIILLGSSILSFQTQTFAYTPTSGDLTTLTQLKSTLAQIHSGNTSDIRRFSQQIKTILPLTSGDQRIDYLLREIKTDLDNQFLTIKTKTKQAIKPDLQNFINQYSTGITETNMSDSCTGRYNTLDNISFANNFPTALTIATRYRETHCGYYLPKNGDGPFQILTKDYGTGEITPQLFEQSVQDFIDFSKTKYGNYKSKIGSMFTYTGFNLTGIVNFAALYNGGTITGGTVKPLAPKYVYEGYTNYASGQYANTSGRYGILPKFLKTLERELKSTY